MHKLAISSPAEAVRALCSQYKGFEAFLLQAKDKGMAFAVFHGKHNLSVSELNNNPGNNDIRIAPILCGSKNAGILQIIAGAVLIIVGALLIKTGPVATGLISTGIAMIFGGVIQLLSPLPKDKRKEDRPPSYAFGGPVNTTAQGNPVPVLYGELIIGSAVVSAGIISEDIFVPTPFGFGPGFGPGGGFNGGIVRE